MIKNGGQALIDSLVILFNWSFKTGYSKYLLLSGVGKLLERIITMRLMWYLNENKLLYQCQAGFQYIGVIAKAQDEKRIWIERKYYFYYTSMIWQKQLKIQFNVECLHPFTPVMKEME
ncbi:hypothetical protein RFI_03664 [Reticulomyxa filosa]|uniref:Uncharacterized protein n=1 Tax=Reticulomyxa filosa TaxID=46433 RepID=X6P5I0_RETFI|nr:hypothetical protein RFI_03664 [Reticulomyxa filosa]|eukprot:ETO33441.1 hypothetical protein RFI_03664 [Reticulomyxa filosa]